MSGARRISLFLFTSILLIFTILWFPPVSHLPSSLLPKVLSFFKHQEDTLIYESSTYKDVFYYEGSENPGTNSRRKSPVVDEKDVVVLTEKNFSDFIATNRRKLEPEYSAAATLLKGEAVLAKVEAAVEKGLARKYEIQGYPSVFLFAGGIHKDSYYGERTRDAIATWMRQKTGLAVPTVSTTAQAKWILRTNYVIVMGFLDTLEGSDTKELDAAFKLHAGINFYKTDNADVARLFRIDPQIKPPALVMLKWEAANLSHIGFDGQFTKSEISDFVSTNNFQSTKPEISGSVSTNNAPSVITFTVDDASRILGNPMKQLWLFSTNHSLELISTFEEAAKAFRDKLVFVYAETDGTDFGLGADLAFQFGLPEGSPRVVARMANGDTYLYHGEMTFDGIKTFAEEFLEDNLSIHSVQISKSALRLPSDSH
ncbi:protein disulfide isomerase [Salix suchowensis]|nr:protein disulfide isomerase [Salix suchowensis]